MPAPTIETSVGHLAADETALALLREALADPGKVWGAFMFAWSPQGHVYWHRIASLPYHTNLSRTAIERAIEQIEFHIREVEKRRARAKIKVYNAKEIVVQYMY